MDSLPDGYQNGYVALVLGAKHETKKLPAERLLELVLKLNRPVILVGGPEDREQGEAIVNELKTRQVLNGCGKWSINGSASIIEQSVCVISHDIGMMHIAAAFGKKILTIWGNTLPAFGMYPYRPHPDSTGFEVEGLSCRPCSKLGKTRCPKKHFRCMMDQRTDIIAAKANSFFS
jgi:heptosyltransferase-2